MKISRSTFVASIIAGSLLAGFVGGAAATVETYTTDTHLLGYHKACAHPDYEACSTATTHWDTNEVGYNSRNGRVDQGFDKIGYGLRGTVLDTSWLHFWAARSDYFAGSGTFRCGTLWWDGGDSWIATGWCYP
jgi:hypothetical protein